MKHNIKQKGGDILTLSNAIQTLVDNYEGSNSINDLQLIKSSIEKLLQEKLQLQTDMNNCVKIIDGVDNKLIEYNKEYNDLFRELKSNKNKLKELQQAKDLIETEAKADGIISHDEKLKLDEAQRTIDTFKSRINTKDLIIQRYQSQISQLQKDKANNSIKEKELTEKVDDLNSKLNKLYDEISSINKNNLSSTPQGTSTSTLKLWSSNTKADLDDLPRQKEFSSTSLSSIPEKSSNNIPPPPPRPSVTIKNANSHLDEINSNRKPMTDNEFNKSIHKDGSLIDQVDNFRKHVSKDNQKNDDLIDAMNKRRKAIVRESQSGQGRKYKKKATK